MSAPCDNTRRGRVFAIDVCGRANTLGFEIILKFANARCSTGFRHETNNFVTPNFTPRSNRAVMSYYI